jgi:hypothetical protein
MNSSWIATSARVPVRATCPPTNVSKSNLLISSYCFGSNFIATPFMQ